MLAVTALIAIDLNSKQVSTNEKSSDIDSLKKPKSIDNSLNSQSLNLDKKDNDLKSLGDTESENIKEPEELNLQALRKWEAEIEKSSKALCLGGLAELQKKLEEATVEEKKHNDWMDRTETSTSVEVLNATSNFALNFPASSELMNYLILGNNTEDQKRLLAGRSLDSLKKQSFKELQAYIPLRQILEDRTYYNWMLMKIIARNPSLAASTETQELCGTFNDFSKPLTRTDLDSILQNFLTRAQVTAQEIQYDPAFNTKIKLSASKDGFPEYNLPTWAEWQIQMKARKKKAKLKGMDQNH